MSSSHKTCAPLALLFFIWAAVCVSAKGASHHVSSSSAAPAPAPAPAAIDCSSALLSLADCLSFVEEGSKQGKPEGQCCPGLKKVVKEEVSCLCQAFKGSADYGVKLNMTKALALPAACGVKTPPFTKCNIAIGAPGAAPAFSPTTSPSIGQNVARASAPSPVHSTAASLTAPQFVPFLTAAAAAAAAALFSSHI